MSPPISDTHAWSDRLSRLFGGVRLVRIGENALWHAPDRGLAVRLYRHAGRARPKAARELSVARILCRAGVPAIRPARDEAIEIDGRTATLWTWVSGTDAQVDPLAFGRLLRAAHEAWRDAGGHDDAWPYLDPIAKIGARIEALSALDEAPLLDARLGRARALWEGFVSASPLQIVHGDAHSGNVIVTRDGPVLADFDETKIGPVEWDLVSMTVGHHRFGRPRAHLDAFARGLGATPAHLEGAGALAPVKELSALSWLGIRALEDVMAHAELRRRLGLSQEGLAATWRAI